MIDFDPTTPSDSGVIADFPANERAERQKVQDWTEVDHYEVDGKHRAARYKEQAGDPTVGANEIAIYAKEQAGKANFFIKDEDGNVIQLTEGGLINLASLTVATLIATGTTNLQGLLTLDAHLKTSLATMDFLGSGDEVGMRKTRNSATDFLLEILRSGSLRRAITADANDENDAQAIDGKRWNAAGDGTFWVIDQDQSGSVTKTSGVPALANLAAPGSYLRFPMVQVCWGEVTFDSIDISSGQESISVSYARAFSARPKIVLTPYCDSGGGNNNQGPPHYYDRIPGATLTQARFHVNAGSGNERLEGFSYIAIGPE